MIRLVDPFGRIIRYLRISVTDRCNLRCVYCLPAEGVRWRSRDEILRFEEIHEIARVGVSLGLTHVRLTGGEPLIREGVASLVHMLAAIPGLNDLALTTNGVLLAQHAGALARAGLKRINISLDTLKAERFSQITRFGALKDVLAGIDAALAAGLNPVKLNVVVMRGINDDELAEMARLTLDRPLHVRFIELMPIGEFFSRERLVSSEEILASLGALGELRSDAGPAGCGPAMTYRLRKAQGMIGVIGAVTQAFCAKCNRLRLTSTGEMRPCLDSDLAVDLMPALRPAVDRKLLAQLIYQAVEAKPEHHDMAQRETGSMRLCMAGVGG
jgi:cyclic pyranopterin phosphate synthase